MKIITMGHEKDMGDESFENYIQYYVFALIAIYTTGLLTKWLKASEPPSVHRWLGRRFCSPQ